MKLLVWDLRSERYPAQGRRARPTLGRVLGHFLRQVSAKHYMRNDLADTTRRIGFIAQETESALGQQLANTNIMGSIEREVSPGVTETLKTFSYERMSVILWQCTRSLLARVEMLEAKLA